MANDVMVTNISVGDDFLSRVLETAVEAGYTHGIGYWADVDDVKREKGRIVSYVVTDRDSAKEGHAGQKFTVNRGLIVMGILSALRNGHHKVLDTDDLDGPMADIVVQCACFNEVVYG